MSETDPLKLAHTHSINNRLEISASQICGCFYCLAIFPPGNIIDWVKERDGQETARCPQCGIDSVIASASGFTITPEFLRQMHQRWFQ